MQNESPSRNRCEGALPRVARQDVQPAGHDPLRLTRAPHRLSMITTLTLGTAPEPTL
jgi:hypothetical protein